MAEKPEPTSADGPQQAAMTAFVEFLDKHGSALQEQISSGTLDDTIK
eukprot:gene3963-14458_t